MNILIFNFFFSLSSVKAIADFSMFLSYILIYVLIIVAIFLPVLIRRDFVYSFLTIVTGIFTWVSVFIVKNIFSIQRPFVELGITPLYNETGFSFPSSHVAVAFAISILIWKNNHKLGLLFFITSFLIGLSRMVIGVHYPVDVLFGAILGSLIGLFINWFYRKTDKFAFLRKYI